MITQVGKGMHKVYGRAAYYGSQRHILQGRFIKGQAGGGGPRRQRGPCRVDSAAKECGVQA